MKTKGLFDGRFKEVFDLTAISRKRKLFFRPSLRAIRFDSQNIIVACVNAVFKPF